MAQAADNDIVLKSRQSSSDRKAPQFERPNDAVADLIKARISSMRFPDRISGVMVRAADGDAISVMMVHRYESHSEAIDASGQNADAIEDGFPDEDFEFLYVKSERLAEEDSEGFVNVPI